MIDLALDSRMFLDDPLDCAIQELDLLMNTIPTELIGDTGYGIEVDSFLWTLTPTANELQNYISAKIDEYTYYCKRFGVNVQCSFMMGEYRSIYLVEISLTSNDEVVASKKYQFQ